MQSNDQKHPDAVLDPAQLKRIESVHKGFLYQHLYAVGCLFLAPKVVRDFRPLRDTGRGGLCRMLRMTASRSGETKSRRNPPRARPR